MKEVGTFVVYRVALNDVAEEHTSADRADEGRTFEAITWKPAPWRILPLSIFGGSKTRCACDLAWPVFAYLWLYYYFSSFDKHRWYRVRLVRDRDQLVHVTIEMSRDFRYPFMEDGDIEVGPAWTHPEYRGLGIASSVLAAVLSQAAREGRRAAWWICRDDNLPSRRIPLRNGMRLIGRAVKERHVYRLCRGVGYATVTEFPGQPASADQQRMRDTRYSLAARYTSGAQVLEVACGSGMGLGLLSQRAKGVVGGDIDQDTCSVALTTHRSNPLIRVCRLNATLLPFRDRYFDVLLLFEAVYYLDNVLQFLQEARRVMKPGGVLVLSSVNCEWSGMNPSPFSVRYYSGQELRDMLSQLGFHTEVLVGFADAQSGLWARARSVVRILAVRLSLIPRTMIGKVWLKRLFNGRLTPLAPLFVEDATELASLVSAEHLLDLRVFRMLYVVAKLPEA
jgi:ubiquinone/menaquinone biosynthesis C-methylase UbiE/RimJ/RimL family protein N-acetyltransferase